MSSFDPYYSRDFMERDRRRVDDYDHSYDERSSRSHSPSFRCVEPPSSTIMLRGLSNTTTERDVRHSLEDESARYSDIRLVRDRKNGRLNAFVDFVTLHDAREFMKDCRGELEVRKCLIRMSYSNSKERREEYEEPSSTILFRGIPTTMDQRDIREVLDDNLVNYVDIRVIRDKGTGLTKGFGFVDFATIHEAKRWMDFQKGVLRVRRYDLRLSYSAPRQLDNPEPTFTPPSLLGPSNPLARSASLAEVNTGDWICSRCSSHNFKRREHCYKCQLPRSQVQPLTSSVDGADLIGSTPCNTLVIRCLDALTIEEDICKVFEDIADVKVRQCHVMRDEVTHTSRCFAFAELPTVADAYKVMELVSKQIELFEIGGKAVTVSYAKNTFNTIMATLKTEGSYNAQLNTTRNLAVDLAHAALAVQSSNVTPDMIAMNAVAASALLNHGQTSGPAVAHAAMQQKQTEQHVISAIAKSMRSSLDSHHNLGSFGSATTVASGQLLPSPTFPFIAATASVTVFPFPDTTKYIYDESTRFYYDPVTGLLYEPNSKYFYDRTSQRYYYWDQTRSSYFPVPQPGTETHPSSQDVLQTSNGDSTNPSADDKTGAGGERVHIPKTKSAQQIAKEMEKWAKRMNSQKKNPIAVAQRSELSATETSRTADTGYAVLEAVSSVAAIGDVRSSSDAGPLVAPYGGADDSDESAHGDGIASKNKRIKEADLEAEGRVAEEEAKLLDWAKLACLLCSRGFKDVATLQKHRAFSALHVDNLNKLRSKHGLHLLSAPTSNESTSTQASSSSTISITSLMQIGAEAASDHAKNAAVRGTGGSQYRDRAQERRNRYGMPSPPRRKRQASPLLKPAPPITQPPPSFDPSFPPPPPPSGPNVGSRLMEKMGWQEGQGLGRANQGRTNIIEAEFREAGVGLGIRTSKRASKMDNYKDNVKRAMFQRFHELE